MLYDLSKTPAPDVIENLKYEDILAAMLADLKKRDPALANLNESDPAHIVLQAAAYREMHLRQRINNAAQSVMLAYAQGNDLDAIASLFSLQRKTIKPANKDVTPAEDAVYESDDDYRKRIQMAPYAITTAGSRGSYMFHGLNADGDVKDIDVSSTAGGVVDITVLSHSNKGLPSPELLSKVSKKLSAENIRPLTDTVKTHAAKLINYSVDATLFFYPASDINTIKQAANTTLQAHVKNLHRLGHDITRSGLLSVLHQNGVQRVELKSPVADISIAHNQAGFCTAIAIAAGGIDE